MSSQPVRIPICLACALIVCAVAVPALAAPRIDKLSLRGLQAGGLTTLVIEGGELLPEPRIWFSAPLAKSTIKDGATAERLEVELALDGQTPAGIYLLRIGSAAGISASVAVGVDNLPQIPFAPQLTTTNVALSGNLEGSAVLTTTFTGKQGQRVVVDVESRRLGANLNPVIRVFDARHVQLAWSQGQPALVGDARTSVTLPADGTYTIELHDALFRGAAPGHFRMKVGELTYADMVFPLGVQQGQEASFEFRGGNLPEAARATANWSITDGRSQLSRPAPWPADVHGLTGARPTVVVSNHVEVVEAGEQPQAIAAAPVAINGRLAAAGEQDRYRLAVSPGQTLRFDMLARRAGGPLDGVLSIQNEQGAELAGNDDRPNTSDPGLDFAVPKDVTSVLVAVRDLQGRGGADFVYRVQVTPVGQPDFSATLETDRLLVPKDGTAVARVLVQRLGYDGPVKLSLANLPAGITVSGDEVPAGATQALVTLTAPGASPAQSISSALATSTAPNTTIAHAVLPPATSVTEHQPWLREEVALAVTNPNPLVLAWNDFSADVRLAQGTTLPITLRVERTAGLTGAVRLALLTTQVTPRKTVKVNNQDQEVDDVERTLRLEAVPTIAADQNEIEARIVVPADLPRIPYDLALQAELLAADGKSVVLSAVTPARRLATAAPLAIELAGATVEARAGLGETGKLVGKVHRVPGFALPVTLRVTGLPAGTRPIALEVPADKSDFEIPVAVRYGTPAGDLANVKLEATSKIDPKNEQAMVRGDDVPLAIKVVPGDKPPAEQPRAIFEDQVEFLANLTEGGGQASIIADQKYSGLASIKVTPDQRFNPALPGLGVKIREFPAPGEYRYLRFAWKKQGGQAICLQLNHDGKWGPEGENKPKFRYHAGPTGELYGGSVAVDATLPAEFTVVTRDLFADFGEFTLSGIALTAVDGEFALYDHLYLGTQPDDFELVKPGK
ncbi:MAG: hypothetical protein AB7O59_20960 [Pirellulales bacterium]